MRDLNRKILGREKFDEKNLKRVIKLMREWVIDSDERDVERMEGEKFDERIE